MHGLYRDGVRRKELGTHLDVWRQCFECVWREGESVLGHARNEADALRKGRSEEKLYKIGASDARNGDIDDKKRTQKSLSRGRPRGSSDGVKRIVHI